MLVEVTRGSEIESFHRGAVAVVDSRGNLVGSWGDVERPIYARSAIKLIQAIPLVESGAADALQLRQAELALACASHSGAPVHVEIVETWLSRLGLTSNDLCCGPHPPIDPSAAALLRSEGRPASSLHNNCSGKHAGFLSLARQAGFTIKGYCDPQHPVQGLVRETLADMACLEVETLIGGIDGCCAPNFALPLVSLARAFSRIADPGDLSSERARAINSLRDAVRRHPYLIGGAGRRCTVLLEQTVDGVVVKEGAEGVYVAAFPGRRLGVAIKMDDGGARAAEIAIAAVLHALGALKDARLTQTDVVNTCGQAVGVQRPAEALAHSGSYCAAGHSRQ